MQLVIGNKAYSTWSLRPWLVLKRCGAEFEEIVVRLNEPDTAERIAELNAEFRGKPGPTDVLSFPIDEDGDALGARELGDVAVKLP